MAIEAGGAPEVGFAYVTLIPSLKGFSRQAESQIAASGIGASISKVASSEAASAGTRAGGLFSRAFSRSTAGSGLPRIFEAGFIRNLRTYAFALSGIASLTVGFGLKTASSFQQAQVAFTTILGSAKRAKVLFGQLVQFAKTTPFDLPGVVSSTQKLLAFGFTAKQAIPTLTAIGDAAAGLGLGADGLDRITVAIGQIAAKGRVQSDEILQLTEAGVPALRILANAFGTTTANLQVLIGKGLVPANKAIPALLHGLETGTNGVSGATAKFGGLMAKQSHTLGGLFSNLLDSVKVGLARAVKPLVPVLEHALPGATKSFAHAMVSAARDMGEFLHGLGVAKDKSKGATTGFEQFGSVVRHAFNFVRSTLSFIGSHAKVFKVLAVAILGAVVAAKTFSTVMAIVDAVTAANPISLIVIAIGALAAAFIYFYKTSQKFRSVVKAVFVDLATAAGKWAQFSLTSLKFVADAMLSFVGTIIHAAASAFGWIPGIGHKLKGAASAFDGFRSSVVGTLSKLATDAGNLGTLAGSLFGHNFVTSSQIGVYGQGRDPGHVGFVLKGAKKKNKDAAAAAGATVPQALATGITKGTPKVAKATTSLVSKILGPLQALIKKAKELASSVTQAILGDTGFGAILNATDAFGQTGFGTSVRAIIKGFVAQRSDVIRFRRQLRELENRGLSNAAIQQIAGEGLTTGGSLASTLIGASRKQLKRISRLFGDTNRGAKGIGNDVAGAAFGKAIAREESRTRLAIAKASQDTSLSNKTVRALEHGFKDAVKGVKVYTNLTEIDKRNGHRVAGQV